MRNKAILKQVEGYTALLLNYKVEEDYTLGLDVDIVMPEAACPRSTALVGLSLAIWSLLAAIDDFITILPFNPTIVSDSAVASTSN